MPVNQNLMVLGAGLVGAVFAATLFLVEHFQQERRRQKVNRDVARLNEELREVTKHVEDLLRLQKKTSEGRRKKSGKAESVVSSSTCDDYKSADDNSDLEEFYDVSDDETDNSHLDSFLSEIDPKLEAGIEVSECLERLENLCLENPENAELLWRIAKAYYRLREKTDDKTLILDYIAKGVNACVAGLNIKPQLAAVHKWLAILIGSRGELQSVKDKIADGNIFKKHVDIAIKLDPKDPVLHHMLGRFTYEISGLSWFERKFAETLFEELPTCSYEETLKHFQKAEEMAPERCWKENKLFIAKSLIKLSQIEEAMQVLTLANEFQENGGSINAVDAEVTELLNKYK